MSNTDGLKIRIVATSEVVTASASVAQKAISAGTAVLVAEAEPDGLRIQVVSTGGIVTKSKTAALRDVERGIAVLV